MPPTIDARPGSGSFIRWRIALVDGVGLFRLRGGYLGGAASPDSLWCGYTPADGVTFLGRTGRDGRWLYARDGVAIQRTRPSALSPLIAIPAPDR